jgi:hypothetical protein
MPESEIGDVFEFLYRCGRTRHAAKLLVEWLISRGGYATPSELSSFAQRLQKGMAEKGFNYRRSNLYRGRVQAYVLVKQPIPKRPPLGGKTFWKLAWPICHAWNHRIEQDVIKG